MIKHLHIENYALIERLDIDLHAGFSVITGETGAGKSIILGAIGLLLGQRADTRSIKAGAARCVIEAVFDVSGYGLEAFFADNDLDFDGSECIVRRELTAAGKSRAFINDTPASLVQLKELGEQLIDIHSQHKNLLLGKEDFQLGVLDIVGGNAGLLAQYKAEYADYRSLCRQLDEALEAARRGRDEEELLRFQAGQLADAALADGEQEELEEESETLEHAEEIKTALYASLGALQADERTDALQLVRQAVQQLRGIARVYGQADELAERLDSCYIELKDIAGEIESQADDIEYNPRRLEQVTARLDTIYSLQKRHGAGSVKELLALLAGMEDRLALIDNSDEVADRLRRSIEASRARAVQLAEELGKSRREAAARVEAAMTARLLPLGMPNVRFKVEVSPAELSAAGADSVVFMFNANKSGDMKPVSQIASGGEIARVMLALKALVAGAVKLPTIIFDEIDTGVSGSTAEKMAVMMREMGECDRQVVSITHLPQIAAMGQHHYKVYKEDGTDDTTSHIAALTADERVDEIAHMLSGESVSQAAIDNARSLLRHSLALIAALFFGFFTLSAQPKFAKKVQKAIVSVNTYDREGNLLHQGTGCYVGANGEAVADYGLFKGASRATVVDAQGRQADVDCVLGADDSYSLVRFRVNVKGNAVLPMAKSVQSKGATMYALAHSQAASSDNDVSSVSDTAMIAGQYVYYGLAKSLDDKLVGCPVFNTGGELVGILHKPIAGRSFVMDVRFAQRLKIEAIPSSSASVALGNIYLPKALPDTAEEALVYVFFNSRNTSNDEYMDMVNRFVATFPRNAEGYLRRATPLIDLHRFDEAEADLQSYLALVDDKATGHYNVASTIYSKLTLQPEPPYDKWTFDVALSEVGKALELNSQRKADDTQRQQADEQYNVLKAKIMMGKHDYDAAIAIYERLNHGAHPAPSYLYAISLARQERGDSIDDVIEPIDSAIAMMGQPMPTEAATYVIRRGQLLAEAGRYRDAVKDYNQYSYLLNNQVSAVFYYERSQIEVNARLFQPALTDIDKAIEMQPRNALYHVEKASICVRVSLFDECIAACEAAIRLNPDIIDSYRIMGYALIEKGDKAAARENLQKAVDMGDENAKIIMEKYL